MITSACFDLETSSLNADFGVVLCAVVKPGGADPLIFRGDELNSCWDRVRSDDRELVQAIARELEGYDILVAHNGKRFDLPFLQTRLARWGLPPLPRKKLIDPVLLARNNYRMSSNSLRRLLSMFGLNQKTDVETEIWLRASLDGDREAMNYIVDHCVKDVAMLEQLTDRVKSFCTAFDQRGSAW
jgi:uncharacterized protein YprB with RNaseH-like and TPR domain